MLVGQHLEKKYILVKAHELQRRLAHEVVRRRGAGRQTLCSARRHIEHLPGVWFRDRRRNTRRSTQNGDTG